jgi:hypothetical protein
MKIYTSVYHSEEFKYQIPCITQISAHIFVSF